MSNKPTSLIILTPGFPASEADSTCLPMQQQFVRCLNKTFPQLNVIVVSCEYPFQGGTYTWFDVPVIAFNGQNKGGISRLWLRQKVYAALKKILQENNIIGLLSFWLGECALIGKQFGDKYAIKHCCWLLGQDAKKENKYPRRIQPEKGELVALSDFLQDEFEKNHHIRPATVIPPGNDSLGTGVSVIQKDIDIFAAGSLIQLKRFDVLLEIISELRKDLPSIKCKLAGNGPEKEKLNCIVETLDLQDCVELTGELSYDAVLKMMQRSRVLLHPSSYEGFSGVCMEALSMGAHVISFTKPMHRNIRQWHIVQTKSNMAKTALEILRDENTVYERQVVFRMEDTVRKMMQLYSLPHQIPFTHLPMFVKK